MKKFIIPVTYLSFLLTSCSQRPEVLAECEAVHRDHTIERWQCIAALERKKNNIENNKRREQRARECISKELFSIEKKARVVSDSISENSSLDFAKKVLMKEIGNVYQVSSQENIKIPVLVSQIKTSCDSEFHIIINIIGYEPEYKNEYEISAVKFFEMSPPEGYTFPWMSRLYAEDRQFKSRLDFEKKQREMRLESEKIESKKRASYLDPCAPGISSADRLERLKQFGKVRQTGPGNYEAGGHQVLLFSIDNSLIYCR